MSASSDSADPRTYPVRPFLAVSAAIFRAGRLLVVRRGRPAPRRIYTLPGGVVETGETLEEAVCREVREETALTIAPGPLAGHREFIQRDGEGRVLRHFVILAFAAHWVSGVPVLSDELAEAMWIDPPEIEGLSTTDGLAEVVAAAAALAAR